MSDLNPVMSNEGSEIRYEQNLAVLSQFKSGKFDPEVLKNYSGWGGLKEAIYTPAIYGKLRRILSDDEIKSIKKTLSNAYYTPKEMVQFIYSFLEKLGFKGGDILEPAVGNGVFIEHMPESIRKVSKISAVEIDTVTANIFKKLYSDIDLFNGGFETFQPSQKYDLIIGNPPYGSQLLDDANHQDLKFQAIHHYFVAKSMRLLKDGGILAMVLPSYFLDNDSKHVRHVIAREGGEMIAAYRLPDNLFKNAKVTVDIVFLRKNLSGNSIKKIAWLKTPSIKVSAYARALNEYYHSHFDNILGDLFITDIYGKKKLTCRRKENGEQDPILMLSRVLEKMDTPHQNKKNIQEEKIKNAEVSIKVRVDYLCERVEKISKALYSTLQQLQELKAEMSSNHLV
jgi:type I restriction-modification system DNA methylase subunit